MSFFDEVDEPPRRPPRSEPRRSRPSGTGGPGRGGPPQDPQAIQRRRVGAAVAIVIVIVLLAIIIHSCDVSAQKSALQTYAQNVDTYVGSSNGLGSTLLKDLVGQNGCTGGPQGIYQCISGLASQARQQLSKVEGLSVPSPMRKAQTKLVLAMTMRSDGLQAIAAHIEAAFTSSSATAAVGAIQTGMARLFASDVVYKGYVTNDIAAALNANGISATSSNAPPINGGQILNNLSWLNSTTIAQSLGVQLPGAPKLEPPTIKVVAVGRNTMATGATNHVLSAPPQTFTVQITNPTTAPLTEIGCSITIKGSAVHGTGTLASLAPNQTLNCAVTLNGAPNVGTYQVTATVSAGPNTKNSNSETFPVDFVPPGTSVPGQS